MRHDGSIDLNPAHIALFRFETINGRRPTQVAERMQITKQSVNDLIRDLERNGYAHYEPDPEDHRARLIRLTARGRRLEAAARKHAIAAECEVKRELGEERFRELHAILLKITKLSGYSFALASPLKRVSKACRMHLFDCSLVKSADT